MIQENKAPNFVFYGGYVDSPERFAEFMQLPGNQPVLVVDVESQKIVFLAWLNGVQEGCANGHFCALGPFKRGAFNAVIDYWKSWGSIRVLIGITPETNERALRLVQIMGMRIVGTIPKFCFIAPVNQAVGGVISYLEF
jgi:hypothetical protein